jgi:hypothetical protein
VIPIFLFAWAMIAFAPQTPIGRALHRWMVEAPLAMLAAGPLKTAAKVLAVLAILGIAYATPELFLIFGAVDVAAMVEMAMFAMLLTQVLRLKVVAQVARRAIQGTVRRTVLRVGHRGRRARRPARPRRAPPANDDEPGFVRWPAPDQSAAVRVGLAGMWARASATTARTQSIWPVALILEPRSVSQQIWVAA